MPDVVLAGDGTTVTFGPPPAPELAVGPADSDTTVTFVPVAGPKGDQGAPGDINDLEAVQAMIDTTVTTHVNAPEPHPAYDDLADLSLIFENGLI